MVALDPKEDGVTHCNVYSKGQTKLGKALTNVANIGFIHPQYGAFKSLEGFWFWLATGKVHWFFHESSGFHARKAGKAMRQVPLPNFKEEIVKAIECKIYQNDWLKAELRASTLPFTHYYFYGTLEKPKIVDVSQKHQWQLDAYHRIRTLLKKTG